MIVFEVAALLALGGWAGYAIGFGHGVDFAERCRARIEQRMQDSDSPSTSAVRPPSTP